MNPPSQLVPPIAPVPPYSGPAPEKDARTLAMLCHLLGMFVSFVGPLLIWLLKKDAHPFIDDQGKEALNFQLTLLIAYLIGIVTSCVIVGYFVLLAAWVSAVVFGITGTIRANEGVAYRYPVSIRFVR